MTCSGPGCFSLNCVRKATEVPLLLLPPVPSIPPRPSPDTPPNNSWPSPRTAGYWSPPMQAYLSAPTCPAVPRPPGSRPPSAKNVLAPVRLASSHKGGVLRHEGLPFGLVRLAGRFLARLKANPSRCSQFKHLLRHRLIPNRSQTNWRTTFQYQLARPMPAAAGGCSKG